MQEEHLHHCAQIHLATGDQNVYQSYIPISCRRSDRGSCQRFDFQPGTYAAIFYIPGARAEGHPHFTLGMIRQLTIP